MRRILKIILIAFLAASPSDADALQFHGALRNSLYAFESDRRQVLLYQSLRFQTTLPQEKALLAGSLQLLSDAANSAQPANRFRLYSLRAELNRFDDRLTVGLGRLYLYPGTPLGALDGLNLQFRLPQVTVLQLFGGLQSPADRRLEPERGDHRKVFGASFRAVKIMGTDLQLFYLIKFRSAMTLQQMTGVNLEHRPLSAVLLRSQVHLDLEQKRLHRLLFAARTDWSSRLQTGLEYRLQRPQIDADSYLAVYTPVAYQRWRAVASYRFLPDYSVELQTQLIQFDKEHAEQLFLTIALPFGEISAVYEGGYAGDQLGIAANASFDLFPNLTLSAVVDLTRYRVEQIYEYDRQWSNAARLSYRFSRFLSVDLEGQWLTDRRKISDARLLHHMTFNW